MIEVHFINVGQGNMVAAIFPDNSIMVYDCNITEDNEGQIFAYLDSIMPKNSIDIFVNSHRDADHMRGIKKLNKKYPVNSVWDSSVSGNTETSEYEEYMDFRNKVKNVYEVKPGQNWKDGQVKILNGKRDDEEDINAQSIVLHVNNKGASTLLTGDTDAKTWKDYIMPESEEKIISSILLASHHGALTFFDDPRDEKYYYSSHIRKIDPAMTIISVGDNAHGHPDKKAVELYEKHSHGSNKGNKIFRTDINGNIRLELNDNGTWTIYQNQ